MIYALELFQIPPTRPAPHRLIAYAAIGLLIAGVWRTYRTGRLPRADWLPAALLLFAAGSAMVDPLTMISMYIATVTVLSLYGTVRATVIRTAAGFVALLATLSCSTWPTTTN